MVGEIFVQELTRRNIYPFAPLGVNFTINLVWLIIKEFIKSNQDWKTAQSAREEGGTGVHLSVQIIFYLFSFFVTFAVFLSLDFLFRVNENMSGQDIMWWLPSVASIVLDRIAKIFERLFKRTSEGIEESELDKKVRHFSFYFWITAFSLGCLWFYIIFGEELGLYSKLQIFLDKIIFS